MILYESDNTHNPEEASANNDAFNKNGNTTTALSVSRRLDIDAEDLL